MTVFKDSGSATGVHSETVSKSIGYRVRSQPQKSQINERRRSDEPAGIRIPILQAECDR